MGAEQSTPAAAAPTKPRPSALVVSNCSGLATLDLLTALVMRSPANYVVCSPGDMEHTLDQGRVAIVDADVGLARQLRKAPRVRALWVLLGPGDGLAALDPAVQPVLREALREGTFDYCRLPPDSDAAARELDRIAQRALAGLPAEIGQAPDDLRLGDAAAGAGDDGSGLPGDADGGLGSNAAAAAAAGVAAAALPSGRVCSTPKRFTAAGGPSASPAVSPRLGQAGGSSSVDQGGAAPPQLQQQQGENEQQRENEQQLEEQLEEQQPEEPEQQASPLPEPEQQQQQQQQADSQQTEQQQQLARPSGAVPAAGMALGLDAWRGRVALVTGASSGIGWAVCKAMGQAGLRVVAVARRKERLQELQALVLSPALGIAPGDFLPVVCDVTKEAEIAALPKIVTKHWPEAGIDVLVNVAGLARNDASLFNGNTASWVEMLSTNVLGTALLMRTAIQDMTRRQQYGHIFNLVGLSGHRIPDAAAGGSFFAATKFAVRALTEGLRQEARANRVPLRVTGISPGLVETEFFAVRAFGDEAAAQSVIRSVAKCLQPEDVAAAILFALSCPVHCEVNDVVLRPTEQLV